jgi:thioredoxin reductase/ferredoxin
MGWLLLPALILTLSLAILLLRLRREELRRLSNRISALDNAKAKGSHRARLQYPHIDLSRCMGCGTCVKACPEDGVLDLIHGQAVVIHGARCVGHGLCAEACPVGAIDLTLGDLQGRRDIPALTDSFEVAGVADLFLAGEVTGYALIRTAISHGTAIANEVAKRVATNATTAVPGEMLDLCIVGAGPAGVAASLQAKATGLRFVTLEQESLGGTVSKYPRRKLVMTQPVDLPLHGRMTQTSYSKEELVELWTDLAAKNELPVRTGEEFTGVRKNGGGGFVVSTRSGEYRARFVCLALGRRGTPRKLGVPGEEFPKVAYSLIDAQSYRNRRILVVGGGDSAIEAALGLAEQEGNEVTLCYRKPAFFRIKARNEARLMQGLQAGRLACILSSQVREITSSSVSLEVTNEGASPIKLSVDNDEVFIMAGGIPPFQLLEECGVSFDPEDRTTPPPLVERGTGLLNALAAVLASTIAVFVWVLMFGQYYWASHTRRPLMELHETLRPSSPFGLACGLVATMLIVANLSYLARRNWLDWIPGSLSAWMTSHVVTGFLALLLVLVHAAMSPSQTVGGHAFAALGFLVVTGTIGRYFYSFVPRAANGKELALEELDSQIAADSAEWDRIGRGFGDEAKQAIHELVAMGRWKSGFMWRLVALLRTQSAVKATCRQLRERGRKRGLSGDQIDRLLVLAQQAYRTALAAAHYEDLRALLNSWRFFHRWVALLMVLLVVVHVWVALRYGSLFP